MATDMDGPRTYGAKLLIIGLALILATMAISCTSTTGASVDATPSATLEPADSAEPAAGICGEAEGSLAVVQVNADVPSPRCQKVKGDQRLRVVNAENQPVRVRLAQFDVTIPANQEWTADQTFGAYLAPGVHRLTISSLGGNGAELWLQS